MTVGLMPSTIRKITRLPAVSAQAAELRALAANGTNEETITTFCMLYIVGNFVAIFASLFVCVAARRRRVRRVLLSRVAGRACAASEGHGAHQAHLRRAPGDGRGVARDAGRARRRARVAPLRVLSAAARVATRGKTRSSMRRRSSSTRRTSTRSCSRLRPRSRTTSRSARAARSACSLGGT